MLLSLSACGSSSSPSTSSSGKLAVVAAENFWGSIATQPTPGDGRAIASARLVIVNGIGYDPWADKLLSANRASGRDVVKVGDLVGLKEGDNPHQWYSPETVEKVISQITAEYKKRRP